MRGNAKLPQYCHLGMKIMPAGFIGIVIPPGQEMCSIAALFDKVFRYEVQTLLTSLDFNFGALCSWDAFRAR
jgi:hypothetical protein